MGWLETLKDAAIWTGLKGRGKSLPQQEEPAASNADVGGCVVGGLRVGELLPIRGVWWRVAGAQGSFAVLTPTGQLTAGSMKKLRGAAKAQRRKRWLQSGRSVT